MNWHDYTGNAWHGTSSLMSPLPGKTFPGKLLYGCTLSALKVSSLVLDIESLGECAFKVESTPTNRM